MARNSFAYRRWCVHSWSDDSCDDVLRSMDRCLAMWLPTSGGVSITCVILSMTPSVGDSQWVCTQAMVCPVVVWWSPQIHEAIPRSQVALLHRLIICLVVPSTPCVNVLRSQVGVCMVSRLWFQKCLRTYTKRFEHEMFRTMTKRFEHVCAPAHDARCMLGRRHTHIDCLHS